MVVEGSDRIDCANRPDFDSANNGDRNILLLMVANLLFVGLSSSLSNLVRCRFRAWWRSPSTTLELVSVYLACPV